MSRRIYYAIQQVGIKSDKSIPTDPFTAMKGVQSIGINTSFNNTPVFQLGQLGLYDHLEDSFEIQASLKKVLDGNSLLYSYATQDSTTPLFPDKAIQKCTIALSIFDDNLTSATGTPVGIMQSSGMYISSLRYNFSTDGNFEEELSLVGSNKIWKNDARIINSDNITVSNNMSFDGQFDNEGSPNTRVSRRQDFIINGTSPDTTLLPTGIMGIDSLGNPTTNIHLKGVSVSSSFSRESVSELGVKNIRLRLPTFPVEVTTEITVHAISGDYISATEYGILAAGNNVQCGAGNNNSDEKILIATCDGTRIYLGNKNRLQSVNYAGGDSGGGNVNLTYSYKTFNDLTILHYRDLTSVNSAGWWIDRSDWLVGTTPIISTFGSDGYVSSLVWASSGYEDPPVPLNGNKSVVIGPVGVDTTKLSNLNFIVKRLSNSVTGIILEETITKWSGSPNLGSGWKPVWTGYLPGLGENDTYLMINTAQTGTGFMYPGGMANFFTSGVPTGTSSILNDYKYRIKGIYGGGTQSAGTNLMSITASWL